MVKLDNVDKMTEEQRLKYMVMLLKGQVSSENDIYANLSNASAIIKALIKDINWAGFYIMKNGELVLGPFQGLPACNRIEINKGVCGSSAYNKKTCRVDDVCTFEGHIACDSASKSEIVVPIIIKDEVFGVLDIDAPINSRFSELHEKYLEAFVKVLEDSLSV